MSDTRLKNHIQIAEVAGGQGATANAVQCPRRSYNPEAALEIQHPPFYRVLIACNRTGRN